MNPGIEFRNVSKRYETRAGTPVAVDDISFSIARGSLTTILGPSGCGKTTTLRLIAGLESPTSGRILIDGKDVTTASPAGRNVSLVFQSYALFPHMDVLDNVAYGLRMSRVGRQEAGRRARATLEVVGLVGFDTRLPGELSGGQQQRVALARALVLEPAVLLFDEPLSNLDARLRREMREEIRSLQQRLGLTVGYVTHDHGEALAVSDEIIVMDRGRIAQRGTPRELYERPQSVFVAGFMGEAMLFDGMVEASGTIILGPLRPVSLQPVLPGPVKVAVRPEAWRIRGDGQGMPARLLKSAYLGSFCEYVFETEIGRLFVISTDVASELAPGAQVGLELAAHGVSVLPSGPADGASP